MQQMKKAFAVMLMITVFVSGQLGNIFVAATTNHGEIEMIIEEVAKEKNIPSVILKAIAWKESNYRQFDGNGNPLVAGGNIGIMQINRVHTHLDQQRLRQDIRYNIEAGADILLGRWNASGSLYPTIGDMDPNVLEHWYFALWGYNGWVARNNPNVSGNSAYQEELFQLIRDKYNQPVTSMDRGLLPGSGLPDGNVHMPTPEEHHFGDLNDDHEAIFSDVVHHPKREYIEELYNMEIISGVGEGLFRPDGHITVEQMAKIVVETLELEIVDAEAIPLHLEEASSWAVDHVATAYQHGILTADEDEELQPQDLLKIEEAIEILSVGYGRDIVGEDLSLQSQEPITRGELSKLLHSVIEE